MRKLFLLYFAILFILLANFEVESRQYSRRRQTKRKATPKPKKPPKPKPFHCRDDDDDDDKRRHYHHHEVKNCIVGTWSAWNRCTLACGQKGQQKRTRKVVQPAVCGGLCPFELIQDRDCNRYCYNGGTLELERCRCLPQYGGQCCQQVHGGWGCWGSWDQCSKPCAGGIQIRRRSCDRPPPSKGGRACAGVRFQSRQCNVTPCPVNGNWSAWGTWGNCTVTCGGGTQKRSRSCTNPPAAHGGKQCLGLTEETRNCNRHIMCPVDGDWSQWRVWGDCSVTCGGGTRTRKRSCTNPPAVHGGAPCRGLNNETETCSDDMMCPVDGGWTNWGDWNKCSVSCGQKRNRSCTNPPVAHGGKLCVGLNETTSQDCNKHVLCPVDAGWTTWGDWGKCSASCGGGTQMRNRSCTNPPVAHGGRPCMGVNNMSQDCNKDVFCPVNGGWSSWGNWGPCSKGCLKIRTRTCTRPIPSNNGIKCIGPHIEKVKCSFDECIGGNGGGGRALRIEDVSEAVGSGMEETWTQWTQWSACVRTCGEDNIKLRSRRCLRDELAECLGKSVQVEPCVVTPC